MDSDGKLSVEDLVQQLLNLAFADQVIRDFPGAWGKDQDSDNNQLRSVAGYRSADGQRTVQ